MKHFPSGSIAVIFCAQRTSIDNSGYDTAAAVMADLAAQQSGFLGVNSTRSSDGLGITVSYWQDDDAAKAWRDHPEHTSIREQGRSNWYEFYTLHVARIERAYGWEKSVPGQDSMP